MATTTTKTVSIYTQLLKAQSELPTISKCAKANYGYYADFDSIIKEVRPILNKHGLQLIQRTATAVLNDVFCVKVESVIFNEQGESISSGELAIPTGEVRGSIAQACGAVITYAKRYSLSAFLGISTGDDTDGLTSRDMSMTLPPFGGQKSQQMQAQKNLEALKAKIDAIQTLSEYEAFYNQLSIADRQLINSCGLHAQTKQRLTA